MFAYILKIRAQPDEKALEFFRRFTETPGLLHAFNLQGVDDRDDGVMVAVWDSREAAESYLKAAELRREVDRAYPTVTRTMYEVLGTK